MDTYKNITSVQRQSENMHSPIKLNVQNYSEELSYYINFQFCTQIKLERKQWSTVSNTRWDFDAQNTKSIKKHNSHVSKWIWPFTNSN